MRRWLSIVHRSEMINQHRHHPSCMWMADVPENTLPVLVDQRQNSWHRHQCTEICKALFPGKLFVPDITLEQFIHPGSCTVWPYTELPPACSADTSKGIILLWKPRGVHSGPNTQCTTPFCIANAVSFVSASTVFRMKVKTICYSYNIVNFHLPCEK